MIPLRAVTEAFGAEVKWNDATRSIAIKGKLRWSESNYIKIDMEIGSDLISYIQCDEYGNNMLGSNNDEHLDSPPVIVDGRTLVPIRAIVELFGYSVDWNNDTKTVSIR